MSSFRLVRRASAAVAVGIAMTASASVGAPIGAANAATGTPLAVNGQLHVCGVNLCNANNVPTQLRGVSSHGLQWFGSCYNSTTLGVAANEWKSDIFRIAMYVQEGGYETNPTGFTNQVNTLVDTATSLGMYSLIDFHTLTPGDPNYNLDRAKTFFSQVSARNKDNKGVIYEIANEPNGVNWATIKKYADQVIPVIRANDPDAPIIVGTMGYSSLGVSGGGTYQDIVNNPIADNNVLYAFHFYAASHGDTYRQTVSAASQKLPLFVSEFGTVDYTGNGPFDQTSSNTWLDLLDSKKISWANWNYSDANETSAAFQPGYCGASGTTRLTQSGSYIRNRTATADSWDTGTSTGTVDTTAPSAPTGLQVTGTTSSSVSLSWSASTDNVGVTAYDVYRGTTKVGSPTTTSYSDTGLTASTAYSYSVRARDAAGNVSSASSSVSATTSAASSGSGTAGAVKVQYKNNDTAVGDNAIKPALQVVNTGSTSVSLSTVTVRYWFTRDSAQTVNAFCDYAAPGCANLTTKVVVLSTPRTGADAYLEVGFTGGTLAAGASTGEMQLRMSKSDWSNFTETNDYSYGTGTAYADATKVTAYTSGTKAWGTEP